MELIKTDNFIIKKKDLVVEEEFILLQILLSKKKQIILKISKISKIYSFILTRRIKR
jgi:hypothetical protein